MPQITTKTSTTALRLLRLIAAATGETHAGVMERLFRVEAKRLRLPVPPKAKKQKKGDRE
jgi:hypothetical protein